jgi:hypothetical protein
MKKLLVGVLFFVLIHQTLIGQDVRGQRVFSGELKNIRFLNYPEATIIKADLKSELEAKCLSPEDLVKSILSCTSVDWEIYHTLGGKDNASIKSKEHYNKVALMNKDKNSFVLQNKFEFDLEGLSMAIIKFYFVTEGVENPQAGVTVMQYDEGRWKKANMKPVSNLAMLSLRLKPEILAKIIALDESDNYLKEIKSRVVKNGAVDFDILGHELNTWYENDDEKKLNYFKDPNSIL